MSEAGERASGTLGRNVVLLGLASFLADVSGDLLFAVLPFYVVAAGGSALAVGLAGGVGDGVAEVVKIAGGRWSDRARRRKPLVVFGYGLSAVGKAGIALAALWPLVVASRAFERVGKGLRSAPRDALLAESAAVGRRGAVFGFHRAMDSAGAILGIALALALTSLTDLPLVALVLLSSLIGFTVLLPLAGVREPERAEAPPKGFRVALAELPPAYRLYLVVAVVFGLANFTPLLFILRASAAFEGDARVAGPILLYLLQNVAYAAVAYPAGAFSDRVGRPRVLGIGYALFALAAALLAVAPSVATLAAAFALAGVALAFVDGASRALAVDLAGGAGKGTALGTLHAAAGVAAVAGGAAAGLLWDAVAPWAAFAWGAALAAAALAALAVAGVRAAARPRVG